MYSKSCKSVRGRNLLPRSRTRTIRSRRAIVSNFCLLCRPGMPGSQTEPLTKLALRDAERAFNERQ